MSISGTTMNVEKIMVDGKDLKTTIDPITYHNAGAHNAMYSGKNLGVFSDAQSAAIRAGTFKDIYIGDYWNFTNVPYTYYAETADTTAQEGKTYYADATGTELETQPETGADISGAGYFEKMNETYTGTMNVAHCDYFYMCINADGAPVIQIDKHHLVVIADPMFMAVMNKTGTTSGGYALSQMRTVHLKRAEAIFKACFGEEHVLNHKEYLTNAVNNGVASGGAWYDCVVELMNEQMVYGSSITGGEKNSLSRTQLSLFRFNCPKNILRGWRWLRNVTSGTHFAVISPSGVTSSASSYYHVVWVCPYALIY